MHFYRRVVNSKTKLNSSASKRIGRRKTELENESMKDEYCRSGNCSLQCKQQDTDLMMNQNELGHGNLQV